MAAPLLLYGGTFDPPHAAHGRLPQLAGEAIGASRVVWIPAAQNPLRTEQSAPPEDRVAMLQALLAGNADAEIDQRELQRGGPSYFVDTLRSFRAEDEHPASILDRCGPSAAVSTLAQLGTDLGFGPSGHRRGGRPTIGWPSNWCSSNWMKANRGLVGGEIRCWICRWMMCRPPNFVKPWPNPTKRLCRRASPSRCCR